jgi:predicted nucleotidyltransferase
VTPRWRARQDQARRLIAAAAAWAESESLICGIALVGSYAYGRPSMASDVDLVVLTDNPARYTARTDWVSSFAQHARLIRTAQWGPVTERRLRLRSGLQVDIAFTTPAWAAVPLDAGTRRVLAAGHLILYDAFSRLQPAARAAAVSAD